MEGNSSNTSRSIYLIGNPLEHSLSPQIQNAAFKHEHLPYEYKLMQVQKQDLHHVLEKFKKDGTVGFNVTIPYKTTIMQYLDKIKPVAIEIGAVNAVKIDKGELIGTNTDIMGIKTALSLSSFHIPQVKHVILFGAGGAAYSACSLFSKYDLKLSIINRTKKHVEELKQYLISKPDCRAQVEIFALEPTKLFSLLNSADLIINATPIGMWPNSKDDLIPFYVPQPYQWIFDMVYNPVQTPFVKKSIESGCKTISGLDMLISQAAESFKWWTGVYPNTTLMKKVALDNLTLISLE